MVSVVIGVFNGGPFLRAAVESVLTQRHTSLEVIVVDDGSTDDSAAGVADLPGVRIVAQANAGQPAALNHGVRLAAGTLLAFNDADDLWTPGRLAAQVTALDTDPSPDVVFGHVEQFADPSAPPGVVAALTDDRRIQPSRLHSAMLIRRSAFDRIGPFDESLRVGGVVEWADRSRAMGLRERMLPEVVLRRRLHGQNVGLRSRDAVRADYLTMVRAALERRRGQAG